MILVRDIFQIKFGKMRDVLDMWKEGHEILRKSGHRPFRTLTDITGPYYTFVLESEFESLEQFEKGHGSTAMAEDWRKFYARFTEFVASGRREIFKIVPEK